MQTELRKISKLDLNNDFVQNVYPTGTKVGQLYVLPKLHKPNIPLRPILCATSTHNFKLAQALLSILAPQASNIYTLNDSFEFASEISNLAANMVWPLVT